MEARGLLASAGVSEIAFATWNIHGCLGRIDTAGIAAALADVDADVIALQEVGTRDGEYDQAGEIAALLGMHAIFGANLSRPGYAYGNALLTRLRVVSSTNVDLSVRGLEPRGCLVAHVRAGDGEIVVASAHLGLLHHERADQARRLVAALAPWEPLPHVIGGDMNDWFPGSDTRRLRARFHDAWKRGGRGPRATYPSAFPLFRLDHVYVCDRVQVSRCEVIARPETRAASDHLPLVARMSVSYDPAGCVRDSSSSRSASS